MLAALLSSIGSILKSLVNYSLVYVYIGQILLAISQPLIANSPGKVATNWFRPERVFCCISYNLL